MSFLWLDAEGGGERRGKEGVEEKLGGGVIPKAEGLRNREKKEERERGKGGGGEIGGRLKEGRGRETGGEDGSEEGRHV